MRISDWSSDVCSSDLLRHTDDVVSSDAKPSVALRAGRNSSMRLAIDAVRDGDADCVVSAGNTGALMAMAKFVLKTLPGINRPAIASFFPTRSEEHTSELQSLMRISYAVFCLQKNI